MTNRPIEITVTTKTTEEPVRTIAYVSHPASGTAGAGGAWKQPEEPAKVAPLPPTLLKIELSISDAVAIEIMLLTASDSLKASAREAERCDLSHIAENHRMRAARAERLSETLRLALAAAAEAA